MCVCVTERERERERACNRAEMEMKAARRFTLPSLLEEGPFSRRTRVRTWSDSLIMDQSQGISSSLVWAFLKRILSRFFPIDAPHSPRASAMSPVIEAPT